MSGKTNAERAVEIIDEKVADTVQALLSRLHSERGRILQMAKNCLKNGENSSVIVKFSQTPAVEEILKAILITPFGHVHCMSKEDSPQSPEQIDTFSEQQPYSDLIRLTPEFVERVRANRRRKSSTLHHGYENVQVLGVVSGNHLLGSRIIRPSAVVSLREKNCFIVEHNDFITRLTPDAKLEATYRVETSQSGRLSGTRFLAENPFSTNGRELIYVDRCQLKSLSLEIDENNAAVVEAKTKSGDFGDGPFGLAVSMATREVFTSTGDDIVSFSLDDWRENGRWELDTPRRLPNRASVFAIRDEKLYFSGDGGRTLSAVPLEGSEGGGGIRPLMQKCEEIATGFNMLRAVTFDEAGHILAAHKGQGRIEVLSEDGGETLTVFAPPKNFGPFSPTDVAVLTAPGGDFFTFKDGVIKCRRIIVAPDYSANRIFFFGSPINN